MFQSKWVEGSRHLVMTVMPLENHRGQPPKPQRHAIICLSNLIWPQICFHLSHKPRPCDILGSSHSDLVLTNKTFVSSSRFKEEILSH